MDNTVKDALDISDKYIGRIVNIWALAVLLFSNTLLTFYKEYYHLSALCVTLLLILVVDFYNKRTRYKKRVDFVGINIFKYERELGLSHKGGSINSNKKIWKKRNTVFWPVLPSKNPNLVHFAFVNTLKILLDNGFDIHVLVYDMYYIKRMNSEKNIDNTKALREDIETFIDFLKDNGIKTSMLNGRVTYKKESKSANEKYYRNYSTVCSRLKLPDLKDILDKKDHDKNSLLRLLKPISIVAFMATLEQRYFKKPIAITLSGFDEEILYNKCKDTIQNLYDGFVPFQMFIPIFNGFASKTQPGVNDSKYRLTRDNLDELIKLAQNHSYEEKNTDDPLNFIMNMLIFAHGDSAMKCKKDNPDKKDSRILKSLCSKNCEDFADCIMTNALNINMDN